MTESNPHTFFFWYAENFIALKESFILANWLILNVSCISYLLLHNTLPSTRGLKQQTFIIVLGCLAGEGNGTPLQYSCLENPMDGGAWWAAVHGVAKSQTRLSDFTFTFMHWRRKWQPTPVFLPGESQGQGSLVCCRLWGRTESDTTEAT